jgi:hypothetical protein
LNLPSGVRKRRVTPVIRMAGAPVSTALMDALI